MASISSVSRAFAPCGESVASPASLADLLLRTVHVCPDSGLRLVAREQGRETLLTYPALLDEALRILGGLRAEGRSPGTNVLLLLDRAEDFLPAFWACVLGGYVPCPLAPILNDAGREASLLAHVNALLERPLLVTTHQSLLQRPGVATVDLDKLRAGTPQEPLNRAQPQDAALLVLTSGSTGNAKAVVLTHRNLLASMAAKNERQQLGRADVTLNWISFDHVAALLEAHLLPLHAGASQVHVSSASILADPLLFLRLIHRHRVTMTFTPNFLLGQINAALEAAPAPLALNLSSLRHIICGGEAIVVETGLRFLELLGPCGLQRSALWPAFGMSETCAGSVYSREFPQGDMQREFAALGFPIVDLQMRIVDESGAALPSGQPGELQLRGPMVCTRYYNNDEATRAAFTQDGWFRTGDRGRIEGGRLSLIGRSKDSIIVNGNNYFSHELETALEQLDGIARSFVAAFATRPRGADTEQLVITFATVFPLEDEARLHRLCIAVRNMTVQLWGFRPSIILPLPQEAFQKTSLGKIQRALLRKRLEDGEFAEHQARIGRIQERSRTRYSAPQGAAEIAVADIFGRMFDLAEVSATANFFDLGGTSLECVELTLALKERFQIAELPLTTILQNSTVCALAARLAGGAKQATARYDPVVPLQITGRKTPLFCVHAASGEVLVFVGLAGYFANERPFYALRARGFGEGEPYFATFGEMVQAYVEAIRRHQPHGPYALAGYSYGGPVAFEIAKALQSQGERVAFLASIDGTPHVGRADARFDAIDSAVVLAFFLGMIEQQHMLELPPRLRAAGTVEEACACLIGLAPQARLKELHLDLPGFSTWARLSHALVQIGEAYVPSGTVETMTVFHAQPLGSTRREWLAQLKNWDRLTHAPNRYIEVSGEHHTIFSSAHLPHFQAALRFELARALGE